MPIDLVLIFAGWTLAAALFAVGYVKESRIVELVLRNISGQHDGVELFHVVLLPDRSLRIE